VPSAFTAFSIHALDVLRNPLHPLYPKVNSFLTRGPVWALEKLPLAHDIFHGEPSEDDRYYTEITWLLTYLLDSLRTPFDLGVFHRKRWFEKILALASNPYLRFNLRTRILRIVYRATSIESGSTTLVTRFGIMSWLDTQRAASEVKEETAVYEALMRRVWNTCDQARVREWSKGGVESLLKGL
jgi:nucleolar pre-ribosomal-associated protein 1